MSNTALLAGGQSSRSPRTSPRIPKASLSSPENHLCTRIGSFCARSAASLSNGVHTWQPPQPSPRSIRAACEMAEGLILRWLRVCDEILWSSLVSSGLRWPGGDHTSLRSAQINGRPGGRINAYLRIPLARELRKLAARAATGPNHVRIPQLRVHPISAYPHQLSIHQRCSDGHWHCYCRSLGQFPAISRQSCHISTDTVPITLIQRASSSVHWCLLDCLGSRHRKPHFSGSETLYLPTSMPESGPPARRVISPYLCNNPTNRFDSNSVLQGEVVRICVYQSPALRISISLLTISSPELSSRAPATTNGV
ncbi:hypothetical protein MKEN_00959500 [Mycena kentingensis (nom. inval.)]|nr:hypothetical protein MKEN_00959500 [Mycena kentingensis (nom. inval.)]